MTTTALIRIKNLKGFNRVDKNHRIVTCEFLESSREFAKMLNDSFAVRMSPISNELISNCNKIEKIYTKNPQNFHYLDNMIAETVKIKKCIAPIALIWLNMGLDLSVQFFTNIVNDVRLHEDLKQHISGAYERTLKVHHNYLLREMVSMFYKLLPTRTQLLGNDMVYLENMESIKKLVPNISDNVNAVYQICKQNNVVAS